MRRRAGTDLCGGRSVMIVPTATVMPTELVPRNALVGSEGNFPVRLGIVGQLCVPFVCRSSSGSTGNGDRTSRLTVGQGGTDGPGRCEVFLCARCGPGHDSREGTACENATSTG